MRLTAEEILRDEFWLNEENYMKYQWDNFIKLIESYSDDEINTLNDEIYDTKQELRCVEDERDELQEQVDELTDKLEEANKEIEDLLSKQV